MEMGTEGRKVYTVSELNREIKVILEDAYPMVWLEGEVSNFKTYSSGHMYFSLKDSEAQISAVIFNGSSRLTRFKIEDGLKVIAGGKVSAYPKRGDYQFIVSSLEPYGKGALQLAFEQLKEKLEKKGYFAESRKRKIPYLPGRIGIVTSPTGAAIRDILTVIDRRFPNVEILIYPAKVQGDEAKYDIAAGIEYLNNEYPDLDVLLVGRGGGSYEDLWAFNEELVARAIFNSRIPVISCVGHETDFTIADFVSDMRAPTPSAAAELVVRNKADLKTRLDSLTRMLIYKMSDKLEYWQEKLEYIRSSRVFTRPMSLVEERLQTIDYHFVQLRQFLDKKITKEENRLAMFSQKLHLLSPLNALNRGYSITWNTATGGVVNDASTLNQKDRLRIKFNKGECEAVVEKAGR